MATRTQARESVIGLLFAYDLGNDNIAKFEDEVYESKKIRNKQRDFAKELFNGVIENLEKIDKILVNNLNKDLSYVGFVEKAILRLAIYEMFFTKLDKAIIINEAIELAKKLSSEKSPKFINAFLDNVKEE